MRPQSSVLASHLSDYFDLSQSRIETFCRLISGVLCCRTVNLAQIACLEPGRAQVASSYRRLQRFFGAVKLEPCALAKTLIAMSGLKPPYQLCLDRTNWKLGNHDINYLVLSVTTKRLRFPVFWTLLGAGSSNHKQCLALIDKWLSCFDAEEIRVLLADREFVGNQWLSGLVDRKIPFVIRMEGQTYAQLEDGRCASLYSLTAKQKTRGQIKSIPARLPNMGQNPKDFPLFFAAKHRRDGEHIVVVSHLINPRKALEVYRQRWQVECQFADWKRRGLNIEDTHLRDKNKLGLLLAIVAIASLWAQTIATKMPRSKQPKKTKQAYLRKSYFRAGWDQIRHWINSDFKKLIESWKKLWELNFNRNCLRVV